MSEEEVKKPTNFIHEIIESDLAAGRNGGKVVTRFPPEPNGYLHIGHAKSICLNYSTAQKFGGKFNLRYDDTNPTKEDVEFVDSIYKDICWLIGDEPDGVGDLHQSDSADDHHRGRAVPGRDDHAGQRHRRRAGCGEHRDGQFCGSQGGHEG